MSGNWDELRDPRNGRLIAARFSAEQVEILRQWFEIVQNLSPACLTDSDYGLAQAIYDMLRDGPAKNDNEEAETRAELTEWWDKQPTCLSCGRPQGAGHLDWCLRKKMQKEADK